MKAFHQARHDLLRLIRVGSCLLACLSLTFSGCKKNEPIDEAKAALADLAQRDVPILTIALDAGFQSIGPFNRAFKADTGLTPTEFRRLPLASDA